MIVPTGPTPAPSTTARLAVKEATGQLDPALVRRSVTALVEMSTARGRPIRRKAARAVVLDYARQHGPDLDGWAHWLQNSLCIADPTGEAAARRAS